MIRSNLAMFALHTRFLKAAVVYNIVVFAIFFAIYAFMDFSKHFESERPVTGKGRLYLALMTHTTGGPQDILPKTDAARLITAAHVTLAWMQLLLVFLS